MGDIKIYGKLKAQTEDQIVVDANGVGVDSTHRFVTDEEKTEWGGKYTKPVGGVPMADLADDVKANLGSSRAILKTNKKPMATFFSETKLEGVVGFDGYYIWTDGESIYYSKSSIHYKLNKSTLTWEKKTWSGLTIFSGDDIWTDGTDIYYSSNSVQYVLNKATSTWETKTWNGLTNFIGDCVWKDGENIYYSSGSTQYVLNKLTSTWETKTWSGLTNFRGENVWTDGESIYYSKSSVHYKLNKSTSTWETKTWSGLTSFDGLYVWTDGENMYYSSYTAKYVLNKATSTWETKTWDGTIKYFYGNYIWTDGDSIYYSRENVQKVLNKSTSTWENKTWHGIVYMPISNIWTDGTNIYYSNSGVGGAQKVFNTITNTWEDKIWTGSLSEFGGENVWTDGTNIYYSDASTQRVFNKSTLTWKIKNWNWSGSTGFLFGGYIWTDGNNIYHSSRVNNRDTHYVLNKSTGTWSEKTWNGTTSFTGKNIWTDGVNIYYSEGAFAQYVLNKSTSTWETKVWGGYASPAANKIWTDGTNIYHSSGSAQYVLNKSTSTWETKTWNGLTDFDGDTIWTDGTNIYCSYKDAQYVLNKNMSIKAKVAETGSYNDLVDKPALFSGSYNDLLDKPNLAYREKVFSVKLSATTTAPYFKTKIARLNDIPLINFDKELIIKTWSGYDNFQANCIWTDGENIYYSGSTNNTRQKVLNKTTSTWEQKTWSGLATVIFGANIWTDGDNIYYSSNNFQYKLIKGTSTWEAKTWNGLTNFSGQYIWTDGEKIYYSCQNTHYVLNKSTSTWEVKTWSGLGGYLYGENIWTDGDNIYYSYSTTQYVLNKATSTWSTKIWSGLTSFSGVDIWTDGENIYRSNGTSYILNKSTSTWTRKYFYGVGTAEVGLLGYNAWTDGKNIYFDMVDFSYQLTQHNGVFDALSKVATTNDYNDLTNKPSLSDVAFSGDYADLLNKPSNSGGGGATIKHNATWRMKSKVVDYDENNNPIYDDVLKEIVFTEEHSNPIRLRLGADFPHQKCSNTIRYKSTHYGSRNINYDTRVQTFYNNANEKAMINYYVDDGDITHLEFKTLINKIFPFFENNEIGLYPMIGDFEDLYRGEEITYRDDRNKPRTLANDFYNCMTSTSRESFFKHYFENQTNLSRLPGMTFVSDEDEFVIKYDSETGEIDYAGIFYDIFGDGLDGNLIYTNKRTMRQILNELLFLPIAYGKTKRVKSNNHVQRNIYVNNRWSCGRTRFAIKIGYTSDESISGNALDSCSTGVDWGKQYLEVTVFMAKQFRSQLSATRDNFKAQFVINIQPKEYK